ncbi:MAG: 50S ribosomal protein L4 [Candidatus Improbicoccus pseudotrichonymphae]|uniref:Large ribosomal subunit protein uL4 n=1 Tax=Candidatus Improbicoccus pseudotrichonymphae TaxID=3033792 RepID=A0AA48HXL3_9FIRM|nr:MAG: 50S ribosomal protein L4 [Candidatus Improbicoccus pseudotrichonymphae]
MSKQCVIDMQGVRVKEINLPDSIFGLEPNRSAMHLSIVSYLASQRRGTKSTLTRAEVSGGGRKPWKQKGTGRARQGSTRSPQWRHGGLAFAPKPRDFCISVNKKVNRLGMKSALSLKSLSGDIIVLDDLCFNEIKTKKMAEFLKLINSKAKSVIVLSKLDENVIKSARNIEGLKTVYFQNLNTYNIFYSGSLILSLESLSKVVEGIFNENL